MNDKRFCYIEPLNCIYDMKRDTMYLLGDIKNIYALLDLINKQISDLQHRLEVTDKAFNNLYEKFEVVAFEYAKIDTIPSKLHFKEQAESELKGEKDEKGI